MVPSIIVMDIICILHYINLKELEMAHAYTIGHTIKQEAIEMRHVVDLD